MRTQSSPTDESDVAALLPPSPSGVTPALIMPSAAYKRSAWIATIGLLTFVAVYLGLTGYFGWVAYRLVSGPSLFPGVLFAIPPLFFFGFLVRGLFVVKHAMDPQSVEIFETDEPRLFAFLHALAEETGAPKPHRVFLSARVNACVFYDLSFVNLIIPSKKNLELGLGLVNVLSLDELKAVVAHEYGHFAQRTMAVGRWVYVAQQIAGHIVMARTGFDTVLTFISNIDLRVAWIGWLMRLFVWAIRAVLDTFLRILILAHRALGRNMEFQADRVAVSVSGSDSLIHALHRLGPADDAWGEAADFAFQELFAGRPVSDLFALQTATLDHYRRIFDEPTFGDTPALPGDATETHRVFKTQIASPPRMWATHPPNREREDHAKVTYLRSVLDARPAWALFTNATRMREQVTRAFFARAEESTKGAPKQKAAPVPIDVSLEYLETRFARPSLDPRYRGMYLGRPIAAFHPSVDTMLGSGSSMQREALAGQFESLYPETLRDLIARYRERREEEALLEGLRDGALSAPGGVIRHRGQEIKRSALGSVIEDVRIERRAIEQEMTAHDARCRAAHLEAARSLGHGWDAYIENLTKLLHFATHASRSLRDAHSYLHHVLDIVLADGNVSTAERKRLVSAANDLQTRLEGVWKDHAKLELPAPVRERFEKRDGFTVLKEPLGCLTPHESNIGDWLGVSEGWANGATGDLVVLAEATLDTLLETEEHVARCFAEGTDPGTAPAPFSLPTRYVTCVIGAERPRQKRLSLWDRFQIADGFFPGTARFVVASTMLVPALFLGGSVGTTTIHAYNGLSRAVEVSIGGESITVPPHAAAVFEQEADERLSIVARTSRGKLIESFTTDTAGAFGHYVYNIAQAAVLVRQSVVYGPGTPAADEPLGAPRFVDADEDYIFVEPPSTISTRGRSEHRTVLRAIDETDGHPAQIVELVRSSADARALAEAHLKWEPSASHWFNDWVVLVHTKPELRAVLVARDRSVANDVIVQRALLDTASEPERASLCERHRAGASRQPDDPDLAYLAAKCITSDAARDEAFANAFVSHPEHALLAYAAAPALVGLRQWGEAMHAFDVARRGLDSEQLREASILEEVRAHRIARYLGVSNIDPSWQVPGGTSSGALAFILRIENDPPSSEDVPATIAYRHLLSGSLDEAAEIAGETMPDLVVLIGASDGASDAHRTSALTLPVEDVRGAALYALAALLVREQQDPARAVEMLRNPREGEWFAAVSAALTTEPRTLPQVVERLVALANTATVQNRSWALLMATIIAGDQARDAWRDELRASLFVTERPYFRGAR